VVESGVNTVHEMSDRAQEAGAIARSTTAAAADVTKRAVSDVVGGAASKASRALETEEQRKRWVGVVGWENAGLLGVGQGGRGQ